MEQTIWGHLPVLVRANSKESIEYILQALWRTRKTGLGTTERCIIQEMLQLQNESDLDPLLVCLRMLIRRCVYENTSKEDIPKLFPSEVLPELQKLLMLLLHKFQQEWQEDVMKDQTIVPQLKTMTWNMANLDKESADPAAVINLKLQNDALFHSGEQDMKFQLATDSIDMMLKAMHCIRDQFSTVENIDERPRQGESKVDQSLVGRCVIIRAKASTDQIIWYSLFVKEKL
ncbi:hypothetical protein AAZX31_04G178000 [Glycine max]|nr:hypothetical protein GLYMA_04G195400v4 [Glycine max]KAH1112175.1 hypothetical protein GYH30_010481 [Glycine max]KAH1255109.1 Protein FAR1-RELATED SEQUENCE 3 [Glycine max]